MVCERCGSARVRRLTDGRSWAKLRCDACRWERGERTSAVRESLLRRGERLRRELGERGWDSAVMRRSLWRTEELIAAEEARIDALP